MITQVGLIESHEPLKAESFLQLVAEVETRKIHSMRRTQCPIAGSEMEGATQGGMQGDL